MSASGVNGKVIILSKETSVHPRIRCTNLVTKYILSEGYWVIPKKAAYMDVDTWKKVVKIAAPAIRKTKARNVACVLPIYYIYI